MKIRTSKEKVEIELSELDFHTLSVGGRVTLPELGPNDTRSLVIGRWKNPVFKPSAAKLRELKAVEMLTGDKMVPNKEENVQGFSQPEIKPFAIQGEEIEAGPETHIQKAFDSEFETSDETNQRRDDAPEKH